MLVSHATLKKMSKSTSSNKTHFILSILGAVIFFSQRQRNGQEKRRAQNENHTHNDFVHGFSLLAGPFLKEKNSLWSTSFPAFPASNLQHCYWLLFSVSWRVRGRVYPQWRCKHISSSCHVSCLTLRTPLHLSSQIDGPYLWTWSPLAPQSVPYCAENSNKWNVS